MSSLLIDFNKIVEPNNLHALVRKCHPIPYTQESLGLFLIIRQKQYETLISLPKGEERIIYINSSTFINNIINISWLIYDKKKKLCELIGAEGDMLSMVLEKTLINIPNDVLLCVWIDLDYSKNAKMINDYIKAGFRDPYITKISPSGLRFTEYGFCLFRENNVVNNDSRNDINHLLTQFNTIEKGFCTLKFLLCKDTIKYLQATCKLGSTLNKNGVITQKEVAGRLLVKKVDNHFIHHLEVDRNSIVYGEEESVPIVKGLYNFHSHPSEAYERNKSKFGWPSAQDYVGFLSAVVNYDTILHIVVSIEGFYILSLSSYMAANEFTIDTKITSFIMKEYKLNCLKGNEYTTCWYINKVNDLKYEGHSIFLVQYIPWEMSDTIFSISHRKTGSNNCFTRQKTSDNIKSLLKMKGSKIKIQDV